MVLLVVARASSGTRRVARRDRAIGAAKNLPLHHPSQRRPRHPFGTDVPALVVA